MKKFIFSLVFMSLFAVSASIHTRFEEAAALYRDHKYTDAAAIYEEIAATQKNPAVYYNLGNAWYKSAQKQSFGKALLNYYRAQRITPRDPDILSNIAFLNSLKKDTPVQHEPSLIADFITYIYQNISVYEWSKIFLASFSAIFVCLYLRKADVLKRLMKYLFVFSVTLTILCAPFAITKIYDDIYMKKGIALEEEISARSGPGIDYMEVFKIHEGTTFKIVELQEFWSQILLENGLSGWIKNENYEKI